jgi:coenzyme F420-0:L-glutamate ligase/coenzyme F420-1:gamma-L-glutamate ligase
VDGKVAQASGDPALSCAAQLTFRAIEGLPAIGPGDDLAALLAAALEHSHLRPQPCDVVVVTSKVVSKAEDRYVDLASVEPSSRALELARSVGKDPRAVEVMLWDAERVSRQAKDVLILRHHSGHVSANAGLDLSNARAPRTAASGGGGPWALRLPAQPDVSAASLRERLELVFGVTLGIIISDSFGRPFRQGTVGMAIGSAGLPALYDQRGRRDLDGRPLENTLTATADQLAAAADLVCGQADEGRPAVLVRGLQFASSTSTARSLCRDPDADLYL